MWIKQNISCLCGGDKIKIRTAIVFLIILSAAILVPIIQTTSSKTVPSSNISKTVLAYGRGRGRPQEPKVLDYYELIGPKWDVPEDGLSYAINPTGAPEGCVVEVSSAFESWDDVTDTELFGDYVVDFAVSPSVDEPDYVISVSWQKLSRQYWRVVAVCIIWYIDTDDSGTPTEGDITVDCDIVFNADKNWGIDPDDEGPEKLPKRTFDVQNTATHEAGHVVGLDDLYEDQYSELTMYGYISYGETKKISLEEGDMLGCQALYG